MVENEEKRRNRANEMNREESRRLTRRGHGDRLNAHPRTALHTKSISTNKTRVNLNENILFRTVEIQ